MQFMDCAPSNFDVSAFDIIQGQTKHVVVNNFAKILALIDVYIVVIALIRLLSIPTI